MTRKRIKTPEGDILYLAQTTRLGHGINDKNDPKANEKIWVLHNMDSAAYIHANGKREYYFWGIYKGDSSDVIKEFKRDHTGLPPAKNPMFKNSR
jgi:hypothetical protein